MRRVVTVLAVMVLVVGGVCAGGPEGTVYGDGVSLSEPIAIQTLLEDPDAFVGKQVRVDGVVTAVCKHRGCWMQVTDPEIEKGIRIKVEDGVIVFPPSAVGRRASAQGTFDAIPVPVVESASQHEHGEGDAHEASCAGEPVDQRIFLIRGTGAVVYPSKG